MTLNCSDVKKESLEGDITRGIIPTFLLKCFQLIGKYLLLILIQLWNCYKNLNKLFYSNILNIPVFNKWATQENFKFESLHVDSFKKIPVHLIFILGKERGSYKDLVKIISWSLAAGVSYISFYDHKADPEPFLLFKAICKYNREILPYLKWLKPFPNKIKDLSKKQINGFIWKPKLSVNLYGREDGPETLSKGIQDLFSRGHSSISQDLLDRYLLETCQAPDPDLAVVCGDVFTTFGYSPWQLRVTQIFSLDTHHGITLNKFINLLKLYSDCEQRYGK